MARENFEISIRGKGHKFGLDRATKKVSVPDALDACDLISAITQEHDASGRPAADYPLGGCFNLENGERHMEFAPGWSMTAANKAKIRKCKFAE